jgi:hypothetical protein
MAPAPCCSGTVTPHPGVEQQKRKWRETARVETPSRHYRLLSSAKTHAFSLRRVRGAPKSTPPARQPQYRTGVAAIRTVEYASRRPEVMRRLTWIARPQSPATKWHSPKP